LHSSDSTVFAVAVHLPLFHEVAAVHTLLSGTLVRAFGRWRKGWEARVGRSGVVPLGAAGQRCFFSSQRTWWFRCSRCLNVTAGSGWVRVFHPRMQELDNDGDGASVAAAALAGVGPPPVLPSDVSTAVDEPAIRTQQDLYDGPDGSTLPGEGRTRTKSAVSQKPVT
jgi:hypothetical protein